MGGSLSRVMAHCITGRFCGVIGPGGLGLNDAPSKCAHNFAYRHDGLEVLLTIPGGRREFNKARFRQED